MHKKKADFPPNFKTCQVDLLLKKKPAAVSLSASGSKHANRSYPPISLISSPQTHLSLPLISQTCTYWHLSSCFVLIYFPASILGGLLTLSYVGWSIPMQHVAVTFREMEIPENPIVENRIK